MKRQSTLKVFKSGNYDYIYVYFKYRNGVIRVNTENKYIKSYHNKDLTYNANMPDYIKLNQRTERLMQKVDTYIFEMFQSSYPTVSQKACLKFIESLHFDTATKKMVGIDRVKTIEASKNFMEHLTVYYNQFLTYKRTELNDSPSMKDYKSLLNALIDYQTHTKKKLTFETVNTKDFFNKFRNYLATKHSKHSASYILP